MSYLDDMMTRLVDMEQEAISNSVAVKFPLYTQATFPYWTNNVTEFAPGRAEDEFEYDEARRVFTVESKYVIGHITEGYTGQPQEQFWSDWITILDFFDAHPGLTSTAYPTPLQYLDAQETTLLPSVGLARFQNSGIGADQVGGLIRQQVIFNKLINRK